MDIWAHLPHTIPAVLSMLDLIKRKYGEENDLGRDFNWLYEKADDYLL